MANTNPGGLNLNVSPYYDDYDEDKKFVRVLYVPGRAVQARELSQSQTLQQKQIERFANYFFKQGSIVDGCEQTIDLSMQYVKLQSTYNSVEVDVTDFELKEIVGANTGIKAYVGIVSDLEDTDPKTLFINYLTAGAVLLTVNTAPSTLTVGNTITFSTGNTATIRSWVTDPLSSGITLYVANVTGTLTTTTANTYLSDGSLQTLNVTGITDKRSSIIFENSELLFTANTTSRFYANSAISEATQYTEDAGLSTEKVYTKGSKVTIGDGVVYIADHFVKNSSQTLILDKYKNIPSYKIGFVPVKSYVDYLGDTSLVDNAAGTPNYQAPGADRLKIDTSLTKVALNATTDENEFIAILEVESGIIKKKKSTQIESKLEEAVAKRTFEESGNYTLSDTRLNVREHLSQSGNGGRYTALESGNSSLLFVEVDPFTSYVSGYRNEFLVKQGINLEKGLFTQSEVQIKTQINTGNYVEVKELVGSWDFMEATSIDLYDTAQKVISNNSFSTATVTGTSIGTAKVRAIEYVSGNVGTADARYYLYLFDVVMNSGKIFSDVRAVYDSATPKRFADIVLDSNGNAILQEQSYDRAIFQLPYNAIKTLRDTGGNVQNGYRFKKDFSVTFTGGIATISTTDSTETFVGTGSLSTAQKNENYLVFINNSGANVETSTLTGTVTISAASTNVVGSGTSFTTQLNVGDLIKVNSLTRKVASITNTSFLTLDSAHTTGASANTFTKILPTGTPIYLGGNGGTGSTRTVSVSSPGTLQIDIKENATFTARVVATMDRAEAREMTKILNYSANTNLNPSTHPNGLVGPYNLGRADVYQLRGIYQAANFSANATTSDTNVTSNYIFNNGQRDNSYEHATITPKVGVVPTGRLHVVYDFFTHDTTQGVGYLSVDSYPVNDSVASNTTITTASIPKYVSVRTGATFDLRNCLDFRPIKTSNTALNPSDPGTFQVATGGIHIPTPGSDFQSDLIFYKGRKSKLYLDQKGTLNFNDGSPGYPNPLSPPSIPDGMDIAELTIPPYPSLPSEINIRLMKNKRYTMKDIGKIEERVNKLEYYTALSLLEKQATDKVILDDDGLDRFKNGIIVDAFTGSSIADVSSNSYSAAINRDEKYATAYANNENQIKISYTSTGSSGVVRTSGNKIMLSYSEETFIDQPYASTPINLAQELTWTWVGDVEVLPPTDNWLSTTRDTSNNLVIDNSGEADNWRRLANAWNTEVAPLNRHWVGETTSATTRSSEWQFESSTNQSVTWGIFDVTRTVTQNIQREFIQDAQVTTGPSTTRATADRVVDISIAHNMRSRDFIFQATGMKSGARLYAFFDGVDVTANCKQIRIPTGKTLQNLFDAMNNDGKIPASSNNTNYVLVSNGSMRVNEDHTILGVFTVPANTFNVGTREFKLTDSPTNSDGSTTTYAKESIQALGISQTKSTTSINTRPISVSFDSPNLRTFTGRQQVTSTSSSVVNAVRTGTITQVFDPPPPPRFDPVGQSFYIDEALYPDGIYITSLDLYFKTKSRDNALGVTLEIREMENGFPTRKVIGGERARVLSSAISISEDASSATTFTFSNPIYLLPDSEYCFVAKPDGNSDEFQIWTAELGQIDITNSDVSVRIDKNNALIAGVLFTSSNDYTWSAKQNLDVKFKMRIAAFSSTGTAAFINAPISGNNVTYTAFQTNIEDLVPSQTSIDYQVRTADSTYTTDDYFTVKNLERIVLSSQKQISNTINETAESFNSFGVLAQLTSSSRYISPYIDITRGNVALEDLVINNSTSTSVTGTVTYSAGSNVVVGTATAFNTQISPGQYAKFGDQYRLVANVVNATYMTVATNFIESNSSSQLITIKNEENPGLPYTSESRYITRRIALNDGFEANDLNVYIDVNRPAGTDIKVYYKILNENDNDNFDDKFYQEMTLSGTKIFNQNSKIYSEERYVMPTSIKTGGNLLLSGNVLVSSSNTNVVGTSTRFLEEVKIGDTIAVGTSRIERVVSSISNNTFLSVESVFPSSNSGLDAFLVLNNAIQYTTPDNRTFTGFKYCSVKIVFLSDNDSFAPRIKNLKAIALA
ncbi:DUF4815 domain-containing protein [bacterium]|nr:DUF4815 domain-containing protein [bacterium]